MRPPGVTVVPARRGALPVARPQCRCGPSHAGLGPVPRRGLHRGPGAARLVLLRSRSTSAWGRSPARSSPPPARARWPSVTGRRATSSASRRTCRTRSCHGRWRRTCSSAAPRSSSSVGSSRASAPPRTPTSAGDSRRRAGAWSRAPPASSINTAPTFASSAASGAGTRPAARGSLAGIPASRPNLHSPGSCAAAVGRTGAAAGAGAPATPPTARDRVLFAGLDLILAFDELIGLRMSNDAR